MTERGDSGMCVRGDSSWCSIGRVPMYVELRDGEARPVRGLPDPSGGTFDAAGDFDRFFDDSYYGHGVAVSLRVLSQVDRYAYTPMVADRMAGLLEDIASVLPIAKPGPEFRGLLRLQVMARVCAREPDSMLVWMGD
ncbi:hypothetical protein ABN034_32940 [Actinopolymorpha sp. B11F2]|uniref:hypothetical protein n=1 Tax=Actinopolymorpha sp. B11F2 TaxID=3160862 RepID=UPI0032E4A47C